MSRRLIVNADDLGHTEGTNEGIFQAHREGIVTSATMMMNRPWAEQAAQRLSQVPDLGVGLHITLSGAPPGERTTLPADQIESLVDDRGLLPRGPEGLTNALVAEVEREVEAQLARFQELTGRMPTHLDSHHHAHRVPAVLEAVVRVAKRRALPVRATSREVGNILRQKAITTTDSFDERFYGTGVTRAALHATLADLPAGSSELMCHPGLVDDLLREGSTYVAEREQELAILCDPKVRALLDHQQIELIHFGQL